MPDEPLVGPGREDRLNEVLAAYLEAVENGPIPDAEQWQARYPEFARELANFIANEENLAQRAAALRNAPSTTPTLPQNGLLGEGSPFAPGKVIGGCELLQELGRGGMGVVFKAREVSLNRTVAVKMILNGSLAAPAARQRFQAEAKAAARLDHPNIVPVYHVGEHEGQPYLCLKLIEGGGLDQLLNGAPLPASEAARLIETLARAIHYAHEQGIVHRDLKPANILLQKSEDSGPSNHSDSCLLSSDFFPIITDFGLSKQIDGSVGLTQTGQVIGTPSYMSPEQAWGHTAQIGAATDTYSLGVILYECLTGHAPFRGATALETLDMVRSADPAPPRLLNPKVDRDLQTICLKCLEKDPRDRYECARDLADDLKRHLAGEPVKARSYNVLARIARTLGNRSHSEDEFRTWGTLLLLFAVIILLGHLTTFGLLWTGQPLWTARAARVGQLGLGVLVFWRYRGRSLVPTSSAERQLWSIWIGYLTAYAIGGVVIRTIIAQGLVAGSDATPRSWEELLVYPFSALLSGMGFFVMGGLYWGRYYLVGALFFVLALLMPLHLEWAPLEFGLVWSLVLAAVVVHLRHLASVVAGENARTLPGRDSKGRG
jgi:tRNA A-37 threonylcarbamoyl transferase component Bud32